MVLMVMTMGSVLSLVQGTWIWSSWMCPDTKENGNPNSASRTSSRRSKLVKTASPPHKDTWWKRFSWIWGPGFPRKKKNWTFFLPVIVQLWHLWHIFRRSWGGWGWCRIPIWTFWRFHGLSLLFVASIFIKVRLCCDLTNFLEAPSSQPWRTHNPSKFSSPKSFADVCDLLRNNCNEKHQFCAELFQLDESRNLSYNSALLH